MPDTNQSPLAVTGDAFKASRLERMLSNFTASYKIYFLKAVFDAAVSGEPCVAYDRLAASMVASAWYPVLFFRLNLGATDQLARVVDTAHARLALDRSASQGDVVAAIPIVSRLAYHHSQGPLPWYGARDFRRFEATEAPYPSQEEQLSQLVQALPQVRLRR